MGYSVILTDIDNTILDFSATSRRGLYATFSQFGLSFDEEDRKLFFAINSGLWEAYERGEIPRELIYEERFRRYLAQRGLTADVPEMNRYYMGQLRLGDDRMPQSEALLKALRQRGCTVCSVTNGETVTQLCRLKNAGLLGYFDHQFISQELGFQKPSAEFFDRVFAVLGEDARRNALIVGDSLTSDMQGGRNAGVATCFYGDPRLADDRCDYAIGTLMELLPIVDGAAVPAGISG